MRRSMCSKRRCATASTSSAEQYSLADIALYAYTHVAHEGGFDLAPYPDVRAWCERVERQPAWAPITDR